MASDVAGETNIYSKNGYTGVDLPSGATVVYKDIRRKPKIPSGPDTGDEASRLLSRYPPQGPERDMGNATPGGEPLSEPPADVENEQVDAENNTQSVDDEKDLRAILKVPPRYLTGVFGKQIFSDFGGILFPYTPQITIESKAEYTTNTPLHSNYPINFYKSSGVTDIGVVANFTVQNDDDAYYYLGIIRIMSALTKMRFGNDSLAGSPPPICRFFAYGEYMLKNVPVVVTSFRHDLPDDVDYYITSVIPGQRVSVPVKSTFNINLKPTYSRKEMSVATVDSYLNNSLGGRGYL